MGLDMPLAKRWGHVICFEQTDSGLELATSFDDDDDSRLRTVFLHCQEFYAAAFA